MKPFRDLTVADYMTRQAVLVNDTDMLTRAIGVLDLKDVSVVPVVNEQGRVVGVLSASDLIQITHEIQADLAAFSRVGEATRNLLLKMLIEQGDSTRVCDVMTAPVESIEMNSSLISAAKKLVNRHIHHLPVVDESRRPIGIISTFDCVRALSDRGTATHSGDQAGHCRPGPAI
jgi:CBS domain-containing membrane protein